MAPREKNHARHAANECTEAFQKADLGNDAPGDTGNEDTGLFWGFLSIAAHRSGSQRWLQAVLFPVARVAGIGVDGKYD